MTTESKEDFDVNLAANYNPLEVEKETQEFWEKNQIRDKLELLENDNKGVLGYVEGPPTLNGIPHIGHARGRVMKDIRYRWKSMEGYYMPFWAGWDCQGLPVELEVEKILGVKNKLELIKRNENELITNMNVMKHVLNFRFSDMLFSHLHTLSCCCLYINLCLQ